MGLRAGDVHVLGPCGRICFGYLNSSKGAIEMHHRFQMVRASIGPKGQLAYALSDADFCRLTTMDFVSLSNSWSRLFDVISDAPIDYSWSC